MPQGLDGPRVNPAQTRFARGHSPPTRSPHRAWAACWSRWTARGAGGTWAAAVRPPSLPRSTVRWRGGGGRVGSTAISHEDGAANPRRPLAPAPHLVCPLACRCPHQARPCAPVPTPPRLPSPPPGVRIITSDRHQLLRRVPPPCVSCLEIGSTSPGALLYDARRLFDAQDARATGGWGRWCCAAPRRAALAWAGQRAGLLMTGWARVVQALPARHPTPLHASPTTNQS